MSAAIHGVCFLPSSGGAGIMFAFCDSKATFSLGLLTTHRHIHLVWFLPRHNHFIFSLSLARHRHFVWFLPLTGRWISVCFLWIAGAFILFVFYPLTGTYIPRKEVVVEETVRATVIRPNQAIRLRARKECIDNEGIARVTGEEWLNKKTGAYLPGAYEEVVDIVNAYVLTDKVGVILFVCLFVGCVQSSVGILGHLWQGDCPVLRDLCYKCGLISWWIGMFNNNPLNVKWTFSFGSRHSCS